MGALVKEVLRRLCVEFGWSYAVFWKAIGCGDQMHLVWEDGHCERTSAAPAASGFEAMDLLIKESGVLRGSQNGGLSQLGSQAEDRMRTLVFKLMATQVHVVGDGIVGKAALMGNHEWLLGDVLTDNKSISKGLAEISNQRLAGIKTITIIPVLPHGIVQLGSTQMVLENLGFVNHVKGLFEQLQYVPGVLLPSISDKNLCLKFQLHEPVGMQVAIKQYGEGGANRNGVSSLNDDIRNWGANRNGVSSLNDDIRNCRPSSHLGSRAVTEPCDSSTLLYDQMPTTVPEIPLAKENMSSTMIPVSTQIMVCRSTNPILRLNSKLESGHQEAHLMFPKPDAMLLKDVLPCESNSQREYNPPTGLPDSRLTFLEEQLLSMSGISHGEFANSCVSILDNTNMCRLQSYKCSSLNSLQGSDVMPSFTRGQLLDSATDLGKFNSLNSTTENFRSQCVDSSNAEVPQVFNPTDNPTFNQIFPGNLNPSHLNYIGKKFQSGSSTEKQQSNNSQFQALEVPSTQFDHGSSHCSVLGNHLEDSPLQENRTHQNSACLENGSGRAPRRFGSKGNVKTEFLPSLDEKVSVSSLQPSSGNDLFDVLRLDQYKSGFSHGNSDNVKIHGTTNAHKLSNDVSTCITEMEDCPVFNALNDEICCSGMFSEAGSDQLLDAVVSQINQGYKYEMNDNSSCKSSLTKLSNSSLHASSPANGSKTSLTKLSNSSLHASSPTNGWVASPKQMNAGISGLPSVPIKSEPAASGSVKSSCSMERGEGCFPQSNGDHKSQISLWIEGQKMIHDNHSVIHVEKVDEEGKQNRKRSRPGENPRPRPKDRQMIQDRVKELREIVPNGAKCSIDALLEKTIKHMLFLQSVTKHADKLKGTGEPKILSREGGLLLKDNFEGGATWAFEVGSQSMTCPIIVEDLNPPRQMLVEMLCEERGLFLEIADLVRGLGLTILKGVMEARNDKVWARFAVEANRDVTRMEIFLSLVRLLEPSAGSNKAPEGVGNLNKPHNMFHPPSSVPATCMSDRVW